MFMLRPNIGNEEIALGYIFFIEAFYTCLLITVVCHLKYSKYGPSDDTMLCCISTPITIYCIIGLCGDVSKACLNPAVGTAVPFFHAIYASNTDSTNLDYVISYIFGPITGGVIASQIMLKLAFKYPNAGPEITRDQPSNKIYSEMMLLETAPKVSSKDTRESPFRP